MKKLKNKKSILLLATMLMGTLAFGNAGDAFAATPVHTLTTMSQMKNSSIQMIDNDTRVFKVDHSIETQFVRFQNRYGIEVAGHMYLPKNFDANQQYKAIVVSGPFGAVKEQVSGLYAQELAKNGYVAIAFDPSFTGESGGNVRDVGSPEVFTEDYSAAVDFIGSLQFVNKDQIGAVGICGLSGPAVTAAVNDVRIKAVAVAAMYDMHESIRDHYKGSYYTPDQREKVKEYLADMRWKEAEKGEPIPGYHEVPFDADGNVMQGNRGLPEKLPENPDRVTKEFHEYYIGRAYHPRAINSSKAWSSTTPYGFFNFSLMNNIKELSPRPLLLITGDKAHSKYFSDDVYAKAGDAKEMIVVPGATHTDLYDQMDKIPFDQLEKFFDNHLK